MTWADVRTSMMNKQDRAQQQIKQGALMINITEMVYYVNHLSLISRLRDTFMYNNCYNSTSTRI